MRRPQHVLGEPERPARRSTAFSAAARGRNSSQLQFHQPYTFFSASRAHVRSLDTWTYCACTRMNSEESPRRTVPVFTLLYGEPWCVKNSRTMGRTREKSSTVERTCESRHKPVGPRTGCDAAYEPVHLRKNRQESGSECCCLIQRDSHLLCYGRHAASVDQPETRDLHLKAQELSE